MQLPGYDVPVHSALTQPILLAGVPRSYAIIVGTVGATVSMGLQLPLIGIPLALAVHGIGFYLTRRDARFFDALKRHLKHPSFLEA
jgi:type IV secretion system protein TrbD